MREGHELEKIANVSFKFMRNLKTKCNICFELLWPSQNIWTLPKFSLFSFPPPCRTKTTSCRTVVVFPLCALTEFNAFQFICGVEKNTQYTRTRVGFPTLFSFFFSRTYTVIYSSESHSEKTQTQLENFFQNINQ